MVPSMLRTAGITGRWIEGDTDINGVLQNNHVEIEQFGQFISTNEITFTVASADITALSVGNQVLIEDVSYLVAEKQPQTGGTTILVLRETS